MPLIEYVTMANHAEAINGLLYLQGAGWTDLHAPLGPDGQTTNVHFGVGISILVGWNETNISFPLEFAIVHEDGGDPLMAGGGEIEAGRPPGAPVGGDMRSVIAIGADMVFPKAGGYRFEARLAGEAKGVSFRVHGSGQAPNPPAGPGTGFGPTSFNPPPPA